MCHRRAYIIVLVLYDVVLLSTLHLQTYVYRSITSRHLILMQLVQQPHRPCRSTRCPYSSRLLRRLAPVLACRDTREQVGPPVHPPPYCSPGSFVASHLCWRACVRPPTVHFDNTPTSQRQSISVIFSTWKANATNGLV